MVELELERADRILLELPTYVQQQYWDTLTNRMYYASFHAVCALLIANGIQVGTHKGAIMKFNSEFVRKGVFTIEEGRLFSQLESLRERGDYNCFIDATEQEIMPFVEPLNALIEKIKRVINE